MGPTRPLNGKCFETPKTNHPKYISPLPCTQDFAIKEIIGGCAGAVRIKKSKVARCAAFGAPPKKNFKGCAIPRLVCAKGLPLHAFCPPSQIKTSSPSCFPFEIAGEGGGNSRMRAPFGKKNSTGALPGRPPPIKRKNSWFFAPVVLGLASRAKFLYLY